MLFDNLLRKMRNKGILKINPKKTCNEKNIANEIKSISYEIFVNSTIHGIPSMLRSRNIFIKILWVICFVTSNVCCAFVIIKSLNNYLAFEIVTQINEVNEQSSEFPALSFCSTQGSFNKWPVLACVFNKKDCSSYFESYQDSYYGKCYRFNAGSNSTHLKINPLRMTSGGGMYGLILDLNLTNENNTDFNELALIIHNKSMKINNLRNRGYRLLSGSLNYFEINRIVYEKLDEPFNNCYSNISLFRRNRTLVNFFLNSSLAYSRVDCHRYCRNLHVLQNSSCNCTRTFQSAAECSRNKLSKKCYDDYLAEFQSKNVFEICSEYCPEECKTFSHSITTFSQFIPGIGKIDWNNTFDIPQVYKDYNEIRKYYVSIRAYYEELKYTFITQITKSDLVDLVSSIGGTLGLFLGLSFLSFMEIFQYFIETIIILARNR